MRRGHGRANIRCYRSHCVLEPVWQAGAHSGDVHTAKQCRKAASSRTAWLLRPAARAGRFSARSRMARSASTRLTGFADRITYPSIAWDIASNRFDCGSAMNRSYEIWIYHCDRWI